MNQWNIALLQKTQKPVKQCFIAEDPETTETVLYCRRPRNMWNSALLGFKTHIMNRHEPPDVKKHFGIDWIKAHKHLISRNYADSAQDRYHSKKWDDFMVL